MSSVPYKELIFSTPSRKYEFYSKRAETWGYPMPVLSNNKLDSVYPYRLLTPHGKDTLFGQHLLDYDGIPIVFTSQSIADKNSLKSGDIVIVKNDKASLDAKLQIQGNDEVIYIYSGYRLRHGNPNILTSSSLPNT